MRNFNPLIVGMTGSGKTQFSRRLLRVTPRAVVLDRKREYGNEGGVFTDWRSATRFYFDNLGRDFHLIWQGTAPDSYVAWMDVLYQTQDHLKPGALGVFVDEASFYSTSYTIDDVIENVYARGRHGQMNVVTATQHLTQIHPIIRGQSHVWVGFRLRVFPTALADRFPSEDLKRFPHLRELTPGIEPVYGEHYLTDAGDVPVLERWREHVTLPGPAPSVVGAPGPTTGRVLG